MVIGCVARTVGSSRKTDSGKAKSRISGKFKSGLKEAARERLPGIHQCKSGFRNGEQQLIEKWHSVALK